MKEHRLLINGKWEDGAQVREIKSPYDGQVAAKVHFAGRPQVEEAVNFAEKAFTKTKRLSSFERSAALEKISSEISRRSKGPFAGYCN